MPDSTSRDQNKDFPFNFQQNSTTIFDVENLRSQILKSYYDMAYSGVNYGGFMGNANALIHKSIEKSLSRSSFPVTVELGSAQGHHLQYVKHKFDKYVMVDLVDFKLNLQEMSSNLINTWNEKALLEQVVADASCLPFDGESVDRILHTCLLHHVENLEGVLSDIRRVLKPGGVYTGYVPCDRGLVYRIIQALTTTPRIRRWIKLQNFDLKVSEFREWEHIRNYQSIEECIKTIFNSDLVTIKRFPLKHFNFNLNVFSVVRIQKSS